MLSGEQAHASLPVPVFGPERRMRLLNVEDSPLDARLLLEALHEASIGSFVDVEHVTTLGAACDRIAEQTFDCVLLDLGLPDGVGVDNVRRLLDVRADITLVVMTGDDSSEVGMQAIQQGAQEYLVKGQVEAEALARILRHAMQRNALLQELKTLRAREYFMATHDPLTGLPNRQLFEDRAEQLLTRAERDDERLALCYLDLDGFKPVNDRHGHGAGDRLLREVARALSEAVRDSDTVARVGGDEFVLILYPLEDAEQAATIARRIVEAIGRIDRVDDHAVRISTSVGIALYPEHGTELQALVHRADAAMYVSKRCRRGDFRLFKPAMLDVRDAATQSEVLSQQTIEQAIRLGQFAPDYQPWLDVNAGRVHGVEALLRWHDGDGRVRNPGEFLPAARACGAMPRIASAVHAAALEHWAGWRANRLAPGHLAMNLSPDELLDAAFINALAARADQLGAPRAQTRIHVDAGDVVGDRDGQLRASLTRLRDLDFRLVLDKVNDERQAQAGLAAARFDELRFVAGRLSGEDGRLHADGRKAIAALVALAREQALDLVAVGVENDGQRNDLRALGCQYMQGYCFGAPVAADRVPGMLRGAAA